MTQDVSNYVISVLQDKSRVDKELLLTAMFLVEKWKKNLVSGPDEKLKELLTPENIKNLAGIIETSRIGKPAQT